jgi:hypothetical protein
MPIPIRHCAAGVLLLILTLGGCGAYQKYGYGRVVESKLDPAEPVVAVKVLDPQLFWVDGVGKITCYDKARSFPASLTALTYPVPCLGLDWQ